MRIASFNVENLTDRARGEVPLAARLDVLQPQLERPAADILCLQEVDASRKGSGRPREHNAPRVLLEETGYRHYPVTSTTVAKSMPQFGLLFIIVVLPMNLLSGGETPLESQPELLQTIMQGVPSTHFVAFAQSILFRGAGFDIVWPKFLLVAATGSLFFALAAARFRRSMGIARS